MANNNIIDFNSSEGSIHFIQTGKPEMIKEATITENGTTTVLPDDGYSLSEADITVNVQPSLQEKTVSPTTTSQSVGADEGYYGLSGVTISGVNSSIDSNIVPANIKSGVEILGVSGTLTPDVPSVETPLTVTPSVSSQTFTPDPGVDGFNPVYVEPVDASIDSNIQSTNIRKDVSILGVVGTLEATPNLETIYLSVPTSYTSYPTVYTPSEGFDGFAEVNLYLSDTYIANPVTPTNKTQFLYPNTGNIGLTGFSVDGYDIDTYYDNLYTLVGYRGSILASWTGGDVNAALVDDVTILSAASPLTGNKITSLSFSGNKDLTSIDSLVSKDLAAFNVSACTSLTSIPDNLDLSKCTSFNVKGTALTSLVVDLPILTASPTFTSMYSLTTFKVSIPSYASAIPSLSGNTALETIEYTVPKAKAAASSAFKNLSNVTSIKLNNFGQAFNTYYASYTTNVVAANISYSRSLTDDAISALVDSLYDISSYALPVTVSITLAAATYNSLSEATISKATAKGWTFTAYSA